MTIQLDPTSEEFRADPYRTYAALRALEGHHFFERINMVMLARYDEIANIAGNPAMVRSLRGIASDEELRQRQRAENFHNMPYHETYVQFSLLDSDGALHRRLRKQVFGFFQAKSLGSLEPVIRSYVQSLIGELRERERFDFIGDFARYIPGYVIAHFLGAPVEDSNQMRDWSEDVVRYFDVNRTASAKAKAEQSTKDFAHYLMDLKRQKSVQPGDDLISHMIAADDAFDETEFISTCMLILMAGHGSSIDMLGSSMHTLLKHRDTLSQLQEKPDLLPQALLEMVRYEPPLPFFHRHATEDVDVSGIPYPAGTTFGLIYASANRDPAAFEKPDTFDIHRSPNRHLSFGMGAHLCLGNNLARLNLKIIYELLFETFSSFELADEHVPYKPGLSVRGPERLLVSFG